MADLDGLEWDAAGFSSNPVPGDPDKTEELANHYRTRSGNCLDMAAQYLLPGYDKVVKSVEGIGKVAEDAW